MDPNAAFYSFIGAICDGDYVAAAEYLANIREWMEKGGFAPDFPRQDDGGKTPIPAKFVKNLDKALQVVALLGMVETRAGKEQAPGFAAEALGNKIIDRLNLHVHSETGRVQTVGGDKTPKGLGRTVIDWVTSLPKE